PARVDGPVRRRGPPAREDALPARPRVHAREHARVPVGRAASVQGVSIPPDEAPTSLAWPPQRREVERVSLDVPMPSNSALTKAGAALRPMMSGLELTTAQIDAAIEAIPIVDRWRSSFAPVMNATKAWLRSAIVTANCSKSVLEVKSRHKQWPSILQKLHARQNMRLAQMEDVAGCRVVLQSIGEVRRLEQQLHRGARSVTFGPTDDYVAQPRRGGYRAVHLHTVRT